MFELSVHRNYKKLYDSNERKSKALYGLPGSLLLLSGINEEWLVDELATQVEKSGWEKTMENIDKIANGIEKFGKFCNDVKWCFQNPGEVTYIVLNWFIQYGTWFVIIYAAGNLLLLAYVSGRCENEVSIKIKNRISTTIVIYIAILILNLIFKLYLGHN